MMEKKSSAGVSEVWCICEHKARDHFIDGEYDFCYILKKGSVACGCQKVIVCEEPIWDDVKYVEEV